MIAESVVLREQLTAECMRAQGFEYEVASIDPGKPDEVEIKTAIGWGFVQSMDAGESEIGVVDASPGGEPESATPEFIEALFSPGGCNEVARTEAEEATGLTRWIAIAPAYSDAVASWEALPETVLATNRWRQCMAAGGYDTISHPDAIPAALLKAWNDRGSAALEFERQLHEHSKTCPEVPKPSADFLLNAMSS